MKQIAPLGMAVLMALLSFGLTDRSVLAQDSPFGQTELPPEGQAAETDGLKERLSSGALPQTIDDYFEVLLASPDAEAAKFVEQQIWMKWNESGSKTVDLLMTRARAAMRGSTLPMALQILDAVIELDPNYAEGWNRRATVHFMMKNYGESLGDIQRTLALEPRHFGAISGMAMIFRRLGDDEAAFEAYRRALDIHPFLNDALKAVEDLADDVEGRGI